MPMSDFAEHGAAEQAHHVANEGKDGQGDDDGNKPRDNEQFKRINADGFERIHFFTDLHHADFGSEGAAAERPATMMAVSKHTHFAQYRNGDEVDGELLCAKRTELLIALVGEHYADKERDERNDGDGVDADLLNMVDDLAEA